MAKIGENEFARLCEEIYEECESIFRHNPIGTVQETLLWMLLGCLISYLSLSEIETPCFNGKPDAETYRKAILFVLENRKTDNFDVETYLEKFNENSAK